MFVGAAEDAGKTTSFVQAKAKMDLARLAGFDAIRLTSIWSPGQTAPERAEFLSLRNAASAAELNGVRVLLSVYHRDRRTTPLTARARAQFAAYTAAIVREIPAISDVIVGNEPNLNLFWMPQFTRTGGNAAAAAYFRLLAQTYDALKAVSPDVNVIGGSVSPRGQDKPKAKRHTHSPTTFIPDLGAAYRKSRRTKPIMDAFAFHPYLIPSRLPPTFRNPRSTTVALSDYNKLVVLLGRAFNGTAQPGSTLPIVYDEFGYQSRIPAHKRGKYTYLDSPAARDAIDEARQAAYYRQALAIALCQPTVAGMLLFHVSDEEDARRWQSGVYYADDTPKTSLPGVRDAARAAQEGSLARCPRPKLVNPVREVVFPERERVPFDQQEWKLELSCDAPCRYVARIVPLPRLEAPVALDYSPEAKALTASGTADAPERQTIAFPTQALAPGRYQFAIRVFAIRKAGTAVTRFSEPFAVDEKAPHDPPLLPSADEPPPPPEEPPPPPPEEPPPPPAEEPPPSDGGPSSP